MMLRAHWEELSRIIAPTLDSVLSATISPSNEFDI